MDWFWPIRRPKTSRSEQQMDEHSFAFRVHDYLLKNLGGNPSIEGMALEEGRSTSALRRRLKDEGHTFRAQYNEFRPKFSEEYLKTTSISAKEVAYLLG